MHIKTPPQNRKPMALFEASTREFDLDSTPQGSKCRTEGVGNEDGKLLCIFIPPANEVQGGI